jgi:hypothetical protein
MSEELDCVQTIRDRYGRVHHYFRKKGYPRRKLPGILGSREFMKEYMAAFRDAPVMVGIPGAERGGVNSIDWLVSSYLASDAFKLPAGKGGLSEETKAGRRRELERFRAKNGSKSCLTVQPRHIQELMDEVGEGRPGSLAAAQPKGHGTGCGEAHFRNRNWLTF